MRYLTAFACSFLIALGGYISLIPILGPTPIAAEYWVQELLIIKRDIIKTHSDQKKIVIASGSSTLFSIDAKYLAEQLDLPVINLGLMGGMTLDRILDEASVATAAKDILLLALEPGYYCREETRGFDEWVVRNAIAWDRPYWDKLGLLEKLKVIQVVGLRFPLELLEARFDMRYRPTITLPRLQALDKAFVLKKFANPPASADQLYSIYNMSPYGDIKNTNDSDYKGAPDRADEPVKICKQTLKQLTSFVSAQKNRGVSVFFIHTPYVEVDGLKNEKIESVSKQFTQALAELAPVLDSKADVVFNRSLFLNSALHLNAPGRQLRTEKLLLKLRELPDTQH